MTALKRWKGAVEPAETGWTQDELRRNNVLHSEDISQSAWIPFNVTKTGVDMITDDATDEIHAIYDTDVFVTTTRKHYYYVEVKQGTARYVMMKATVATTENSLYTVIYDFDTDTFTDASTSTYVTNKTSEDKGDGWIRLGFRNEQPSGSYDNFSVGLSSGPLAADAHYIGTGDTLFVRKLQVTPDAWETQNYTVTGSSQPTITRHRTEGAVSKTTVTNLIPVSNDLTDAAWVETNVTPSTTLLTADAVTNKAYTGDTAATGVAVDDVYSFTLKALPGTHDYLWIGDRGNLPILSATIDLTDGSVIGSESGVTATTSMGKDGRWLIKLDYTRSFAGSVSFNVGFGGASHSTDAPSATYAGTETLQIWDIQVEEGASVRTADNFFVRTSGAAATRTFGGNVIYLYKGAVQPTAFPSGRTFAGGIVRPLVGDLVRPLVASR